MTNDETKNRLARARFDRAYDALRRAVSDVRPDVAAGWTEPESVTAAVAELAKLHFWLSWYQDELAARRPPRTAGQFEEWKATLKLRSEDEA